MIGKLSSTQIEELLQGEMIGRIGCHYNGTTYIVPVSYAYDGTYVYVHTYEGMKIEFMRHNPAVCFQVDHMQDMANWQSVVLSGTFIELKGKEAQKARDYLFRHVWPLLTSSTIHPHEHGVSGKPDDSNRIKPVMYRIKIDKKSGRFEKQ